MTTEKNALINAIINLCNTEEDTDLLDLVYKVLMSNREGGEYHPNMCNASY